MNKKVLDMSYECLSAIGNSFELESMMSEVVITFYQKTSASFVGYFETKESDKVMICVGKDSFLNIEFLDKRCFLIKHEDIHVVILQLKSGYLKLIYNESSDIEAIFNMLCSFERKINFALSACAGVKELERLNDELEARIFKSVKKLTEHEKMLLVQSKNAIMGEMLEMIAHQWRQPLTAIGMISNNLILDMLLDEDLEVDKKVLESELGDINKHVKYLSDTIDDFRNFFKESKIKQEIFADELVEKKYLSYKKTV